MRIGWKNRKNMEYTTNKMQNFSVGVDIENVARFDKYAQDREVAEKLGVFTSNELDYCFQKKLPAMHLCARFCAKEAIYKAFSQINIAQTPNFSQIEIKNDTKGAPFINLIDFPVKNIEIKISLSHCKDKAIAYAMIVENV